METDPALRLEAYGARLPVGGSAIELSYSVLDAAPIGMALADASGHLYWINAAMCHLLRRTREELLITGLTPVMQEQDIVAMAASCQRSGEGPKDLVEVEQHWRRGDDTMVWVSVSVSAATDPGGQALTVGTPPVPALIQQVIDIDARRQAEATAAHATGNLERRNADLERSNAELAEFGYVISHDLSEPLRVISGHVQLLADRYAGQLDAQADEWIGFSVDGAARMHTLIDSLLQYSRVGRNEPTLVEVNTTHVVQAALAGLGVAVAEAQAVITVGDLPTVIGDASDLGRVFSNLIANAIKFARAGVAPLIEVTAAREAAGWTFSVSDNGIGIPERHRERAFRLFQRLNPREDYPGTGLGLAICRKIVARYGGVMHMADSPSGGTTISFTIPDEGLMP